MFPLLLIVADIAVNVVTDGNVSAYNVTNSDTAEIYDTDVTDSVVNVV